MHKIERHPFNNDVVKRRLEGRLELLLLDLETARNRPDAFNFNQYLLNVQAYFGYLVASNAHSPKICWALQLLCNGALALFSAAAAQEETIAVVLEDEDDAPVVIPTRGVYTDAGANYWQTGFYAALLLRRHSALDTLSNTSIDLLRRSEIRFDECRYLFVSALQSFWKRDEDAPPRLLAAMQAADPALVPLAPDYIFNVTEPEMELLFRILTLNAPAFNATLVDALTSFKSYWDNDRRRVHPTGYVALGPLALAAVAYDLDMPIEVESEYLPPDFYKGACR